MSLQDTHIVQKAHIKLKVSDKERAYQIQNAFGDLFESKVLDLLSKEFDQIVASDEVIMIDRLQLDLGHIALGNMDADLPRLVAEKFRDAYAKATAPEAGQVRDAKVTRSHSVDSKLQALLRFLETGTLHWTVDQSVVSPASLLADLLDGQGQDLAKAIGSRLHLPNVAERLSLQLPTALLDRLIVAMKPDLPSRVAKPMLELVEHFAAEFAWFPSSRNRRTAMVYAWILRNLMQVSKSDGTSFLAKMIQENLDFGRLSRNAIASQLQTQELPALLTLLPLLDHSMADWSRSIAPKLHRNEALGVQVQRILRAVILSWLRGEVDAPSHEAIQQHSNRILPELSASERIDLQSILATKAGSTAESTLRKKGKHSTSIEPEDDAAADLKRKLDAEKGNEDTSILESDAGDNSDETQKLEGEASKEEVIRRMLKGEDSKHPQVPRKKPHALSPELSIALEEEEAIYVDNAGLVLLNPFLKPCFEEFGWIENGNFVDEMAHENAVMFTAFLASGEQEISEARLPVAKLLCGMDLYQTVRYSVDLPTYILEEADALLTAANGHWEKAGKLTPAQFREAFLLREGRLKALESGWNLKVDRHTIDILLEFLPWSFGMIKLPWMASLLTVDW